MVGPLRPYSRGGVANPCRAHARVRMVFRGTAAHGECHGRRAAACRRAARAATLRSLFLTLPGAAPTEPIGHADIGTFSEYPADQDEYRAAWRVARQALRQLANSRGDDLLI